MLLDMALISITYQRGLPWILIAFSENIFERKLLAFCFFLFLLALNFRIMFPLVLSENQHSIGSAFNHFCLTVNRLACYFKKLEIPGSISYQITK